MASDGDHKLLGIPEAAVTTSLNVRPSLFFSQPINDFRLKALKKNAKTDIQIKQSRHAKQTGLLSRRSLVSFDNAGIILAILNSNRKLKMTLLSLCFFNGRCSQRARSRLRP